MRLGNRDHSVRVASQDVALVDPGVADVHWPAHGLHLDTILAGAHGITAAVDGIPEFTGKMSVTACPVDHRTGHSAASGDPGQNIAPYGRIFAPAIIQHDHAPGRNVLDVIA